MSNLKLIYLILPLIALFSGCNNSRVEQTQDTSDQSSMSDLEKLKLALNTCIKNYTWFTPDPSPFRKTESGKDVIVGKGSNGNIYYFYADLKVVNATTGTEKKWKCDALSNNIGSDMQLENICQIHNKDCKKIGTEMNMSLEEYHQWQDKQIEAINWEDANTNAEGDIVDPNSNTSTYETIENQRQECYNCNGTGKCRKCCQSSKKSYYIGDGRYNERPEINLGYVLCSSCYGRGHTQRSAKSGGWEPDNDCYTSNCQDGWVQCDECNRGYNSDGKDIGLCKSCKGTGYSQ